MPHPPHTPAGKFAALRLRLGQWVARQTGWGISLLLIKLIIDKLRGAGERFERLVQRIEAGTFTPRYRAKTPPPDPAQQTPTPPKRPKSPSALPTKFGWLLPLVEGSAPYGGMLENLFRDPAMLALMEKAPQEFGRILRPLCWMLAVKPPSIIAWPRKPRQPRAPRPRAPRPSRKRRYNAAVQGPIPPRPARPAPPPPVPPPAPSPSAQPPRAPPRSGLALEYDAWGKPRLVWI